MRRTKSLLEHNEASIRPLSESQHKVVLDESGFSAYCVDVDWGLNFLSFFTTMTTIPLIYCANHMFVDLPEGRWLVDTGSPATFGTPGHVTWGGVQRSVPQQFGPVGIPEIQTHVDSPFVGMIGTDLLNAQDSCWDGPAGEFRIGDANVHPEATPIEFERLMGVPTLQARIGAHSARCLFDTGAQFGYVLNEQLVEGGIPDGRITDFNPIIGAIDSAAWRAEVGLGATRFTERFGLLSGAAAEMLKIVGIDALIGCSWLHARTVWYQPGLRRISISAAR